MALVRLDGMLKEFVPRRKMSTEVGSVEALLDELEAQYPRLRRRLRDEAGIQRRFVKIFVNGEEIGGLSGFSTPLRASDEVDILHSIQGG